jgi:hypothetical protein
VRERLTPLANEEIAQRWIAWPNIGFLSPVPIITALLAGGEWYALTHRHEMTPFLGGISLFLMSFIGIAISLWPMIVPFHYTLWGGRIVGKYAGVPAYWHAVPVTDHPDLHRLVILGVSREGSRGHRLSLNSLLYTLDASGNCPTN